MKHILLYEQWLAKKGQPFLFEGGAYGHMAHVYEDKDLTFDQMFEIIDRALSGNLDKEVGVSEKLDGQALSVSWRDGQAIYARNKGHLANSGAAALNTKETAEKFEGRGELTNAFQFAVEDLSNAISQLSDADKEKVFANGKKFMGFEIIYPPNSNVINYDVPKLVLHGALEYDDKGNAIGEDKGSGKILGDLIKKVNADVQKNFQIQPPIMLKLPKSLDFSASIQKFISPLAKLQHEYDLNDGSSIRDYLVAWWKKWLDDKEAEYGYVVPDGIRDRLINRLAFEDKALNIREVKKTIDDTKFLELILKLDKGGAKTLRETAITPIKLVFLKLGAQIMRNLSGFLAANPDKEVQNIRNEIVKVARDIEKSGSASAIAKAEHQLGILQSLGGLDAVVPSEGRVFQYDGKTYKFTGTFAPVNQLLGTLKYAR